MFWRHWSFKLWAIGSALWATLIWIATSEPRNYPYVPALAFVLHKGSVVPKAVEMGSTEYQLLAGQVKDGTLETVRLGRADEAVLAANQPDAERADQLRRIQDAYPVVMTELEARSKRDAIGRAIQMATIAPLTLLALGLFIGWFLSGLRAAKN